MKNKKQSSISLFFFIITMTGDIPSSGGLLMMIVAITRLSTRVRVYISWFVSGLSVVLFVTFFKATPMEKGYRSASRRAVRCILDGFWHICIDRCCNKDWKDYVHRNYDKLTLARAKGLISYALVLLPIAGYILFILGKFDNFYAGVQRIITPTGLHLYMGMTPGWALVVYLTMLTTYFLIIPGLTHLRYPKQFNYRFSLGYLFAVLGCYYLAIVLKLNEKYDYDSEVGYIRIYNARDSEVVLIPQETGVKNASLVVPPHMAVMWSSVTKDDELLLTLLKFDETTNITVHLMAKSKTCIGYAITDPPEIIRVTNEIPLFEGTSGTNDQHNPRIYLFNAARANDKRTIRFREVSTGQWILKLVSILGRTDIFQVPPGKYEVWVEGTELHVLMNFQDGGLYGILLLADFTKDLLELDTVVLERQLPSSFLTIFSIFFGVALTFSYIPLLIMTYQTAPSGLVNTVFGILSAQKNLVMWILVLGYQTWHSQLFGDALLVYCFILTFLFFMSVFMTMIKYNQLFA